MSLNEMQPRKFSADAVNRLQKQGLHPIVARLYAARGLDEVEDMARQLNQLSPIRRLKGIDSAAKRLAQAVIQNQAILIVGDFDCDGATSTAIAVLALRQMGVQSVDYLVPNRFEYGYGLSPEIVDVAAIKSPDLIVTVDNGISSIDGVKRARERGIDVVITDHHLPGDHLPDACAIVNPNQPDCDYPSKNICGAGVVFFVMLALKQLLQTQGYFTDKALVPPNLANLLDIVALGTVADVVALDKDNRILVHQGIARIRAGRLRPGIKALLQVAGRNPATIQATDLGFAVAPRLNAAGRLQDMSIGIECLLTEQEAIAQQLAVELNNLNQERRSIEADMQQQASDFLQHLAVANDDFPWGVCLYNPDWHQGVIGILASRIKERLHRPAIIFAPGEVGEIKGSARSIEGFHIRDGLDAIAVGNPGLIRKFGGHAMAAGLTLGADQFERFRKAFNEQVMSQLTEAHLQRIIFTDGLLTSAELTMTMLQILEEAGPWGHQFPEPVFEGEFRVIQQRIVGYKHLKVVLMPLGSELALDAIAFNVDTERWPDTRVQQIKVAYRLARNEFRGNISLQLILEAIETVSTTTYSVS